MSGTEEWISVTKRGGTAKSSAKLEGSGNHSSKREASGNVAAAQVVIILVGLPGSGKSWFASQLQRGDSRFVRINQDTLGTRKKCEDSCCQALSRGRCVVIDRCNFDSSQRQHWVDIAKQFGLPCHCIVFNYNKEECIRRCKERVGHETINYGNAAMVVRGMAKKFRPPLPHSGQYQRHITITSFRQANEVVQSYLDRGSSES